MALATASANGQVHAWRVIGTAGPFALILVTCVGDVNRTTTPTTPYPAGRSTAGGASRMTAERVSFTTTAMLGPLTVVTLSSIGLTFYAQGIVSTCVVWSVCNGCRHGDGDAEVCDEEQLLRLYVGTHYDSVDTMRRGDIIYGAIGTQ